MDRIPIHKSQGRPPATGGAHTRNCTSERGFAEEAPALSEAQTSAENPGWQASIEHEQGDWQPVEEVLQAMAAAGIALDEDKGGER